MKSLDWYKEAALDPNAYKNEANPARLQRHQDMERLFNPWSGETVSIPREQNQKEIDKLYSGVHFALSEEQAAIYACNKATKTDPPVIIEIDPIKLKRQTDVDAMIDQGMLDYVSNKKTEWQQILQSGEDAETIAYKLYEEVENDSDFWNNDSGEILDTALDAIVQQQTPSPPNLIKSLIDKKPEQTVINLFQSLIDGKISGKILIRMVGQFRVKNNIDSSRVKAIYQVPWIDLSAEITQDPHSMSEDQLEDYLEEQGWHMEGDDIFNEHGQVIPSYEELIYDQWLSKTVLYKNRQMYFKGFTGKDSVWHGTTLSRAKQAYPDLLGSIPMPQSNEVVEASNKKIIKTADTIRGEWWICDGDAWYSDGSVGDINHEGYIIQQIQGKYAYDEFNLGDYVEWKEFEEHLLEEKLDEMGIDKNSFDYENDRDEIITNALMENGMGKEEIAIARGGGNPRQYGLEKWKYQMVRGDNIETHTLTEQDLSNISRGLSSICDYEGIDHDLDFEVDIEVHSTGMIYRSVPYSIIEKKSPVLLNRYRANIGHGGYLMGDPEPTEVTQMASNKKIKELDWYKPPFMRAMKYMGGLDD